MRSVSRTLELLNEARSQWALDCEPDIGVHEFGDFALIVSTHEFPKNETKRRYVVKYIDPDIDMTVDCPLTMAYDWGHLRANLEDPSRHIRYEPTEEEDMTKLSIHDSDLREKVKLKCKNDWDLDLTEDQISMCIMEMEEQRLSIFHNQIWPNKRKWTKRHEAANGYVTWEKKERITWDKSIDGYRAIAQRTQRFAGMDEPIFEESDEGLVAKVTVYALDSRGQRCAFVGAAKFTEFVQLVDEYKWNDKSKKKEKTGKRVPNSQWADKPHNQLSIAAERQALRKAFQDLGDDEAPVADLPEPALEESRGDEAPLPHQEAPGKLDATPEPAPKSKPKPEPKPEPKKTKPKSRASVPAPVAPSEPPEPEPPKVRGAFVGLPKEGFKAGKLFNKEERIVMYALFKNSIHVLALDSGKRIQIDMEGYEIERVDRTDKNKGGRDWKIGDTYYDGSRVEKLAPSKKDEWALRLALTNGYEVRVNRWGKEEKRRERKATITPPASTSSAAAQSKPATGGAVDIEAIDSVEKLRQVTMPLLKKWCDTVLKKRVNPKEAYKEFTGVVLQKGQSMSLDDYKVLYESLAEVLEGPA